MREVRGWWFGTLDKKLGYNDNRDIVVGKTHKIIGKIKPCEYGLHLSKRILDALYYAPGPVIYQVVGSGEVQSHGHPIDKYACSERTYIAGGIDISDVLCKFARMCASDVTYLWDAPPVVLDYLKSGNESLRVTTWDIAWEAALSAESDSRREAAYACKECCPTFEQDGKESFYRGVSGGWVHRLSSPYQTPWSSAKTAAIAAASAKKWEVTIKLRLRNGDTWDDNDTSLEIEHTTWETARAAQNRRLTAMVKKALMKKEGSKWSIK